MELTVQIYLVIINVISFIFFGIDKYKAKNNQWRISEKTLFLLAFLGGGIGGLIGIKLFRHKTRHISFTVGFPVIIFLQIAVIYYFQISFL